MAIAFDAAASGSGSGTSLTYSHTCGGSASAIVVGVLNGSAQNCTGVTYAGTAMTKVSTYVMDDGGGYEITLWYLLSPSTGANNVVISINASTGAIFGRSSSYTGTITSGSIGAHTTGTATSTSLTTTLTTTLDNSWTVLFGRNSNDWINAGTGSTRRSPVSGNADTAVFDSNTAITPAGSTSMEVTSPSSQKMVTIMFELPVLSTGSTAKNLTLLGVGI